MTTQRLNSDTRRLGKFDTPLRVTVTPDGFAIINKANGKYGAIPNRFRDCADIRPKHN